MSTACSVNVDMIGIFKSSFDMLKYLTVLSYRAGVALFSLVSREQLAFFTLFLRKNANFCQKVCEMRPKIFAFFLETLLSFLAVYWIETNQQTDRQAKYIQIWERSLSNNLKHIIFKFLNSFKCDKKLY